MSRITEGHLVRHYQGAKGGRDAALLDMAQDHALWHLHRLGLFDRGLTFKGGTALRKFRAGNSGRFSTDLDFAAPDEETALAVLDALDGADIDGFTFALQNLGDDGRRADLTITTPFGSPRLGAKVELARHALALAPENLAPVPLPIHTRYDFDLPALPVVRAEEAVVGLWVFFYALIELFVVVETLWHIGVMVAVEERRRGSDESQAGLRMPKGWTHDRAGRRAHRAP